MTSSMVWCKMSVSRTGCAHNPQSSIVVVVVRGHCTVAIDIKLVAMMQDETVASTDDG